MRSTLEHPERSTEIVAAAIVLEKTFPERSHDYYPVGTVKVA
jgi:hypothetical protein